MMVTFSAKTSLIDPDLRLIGRVRKIAVEKEQAYYQHRYAQVTPVTFSAGASESDHSGT